ncbi:MAG: site-specific integrase [Candidatus Binataceae bacterium]|jgi:integrase
MARKRGHNEGTIFHRNDGRWCADIDLGWENGKRKRKSLYGTTRKEVAEALNKALREKAQGLPVAIERQTVAQFLAKWLTDSVKSSVRPLTFEQYAQHVRLYIEPAIGNIQLSKLSPQQVQGLINAKLQDGLSPRTVQITLFVLRKALAQAVKWDLVIRNVAEVVDRPRVESKEIRPLTSDQVQHFFNALKDERMEAVFTVGLALGLRRGEVLGLRWEDVNFEDREISIKQALQRSGGRYVNGEGSRSVLHFVRPKSERGVRTIAMPERVAAVLRGHRARQAEERLLAGSKWTDLGLVFTARNGTPIEPRRLDTEFKKVLKRANLPETIRLHDSRHFAASLLLSQGVHPRTVMEILGHSDISLTMNTYSHVVPDLMREAADKIDAALGGR